MFTKCFRTLQYHSNCFLYTKEKTGKELHISMSERNNAPRSKGFFHEKSGAGATVASVFLLLFLLICLLFVFSVHTVASVFEQRGLQSAMERFLKSDEIRNDFAETIRETFPKDLITDEQVDALMNDDVILEAASQYLYEALHFEDESVNFYDHILSTLDDPASAALYSKALDRFTETLGVDDESYREALEAVAEEMQITLPEGETDKLALATTILNATVGEQRDQLPDLTLGSIVGESSGYSEVLSIAQKALILFETPRFILYNLLLLAVCYGLILLAKRSYRKPFLYCCIPYFAVGILLLVASSLLSFAIAIIGKPGGIDISVFTDIASGALLRSTLFAFGFALPLLIAYILLTVLRRKRASGAAAADMPEAVPIPETAPAKTEPAAITDAPSGEETTESTDAPEDGDAAVAKEPEEITL